MIVAAVVADQIVAVDTVARMAAKNRACGVSAVDVANA